MRRRHALAFAMQSWRYVVAASVAHKKRAHKNAVIRVLSHWRPWARARTVARDTVSAATTAAARVRLRGVMKHWRETVRLQSAVRGLRASHAAARADGLLRRVFRAWRFEYTPRSRALRLLGARIAARSRAAALTEAFANWRRRARLLAAARELALRAGAVLLAGKAAAAWALWRALSDPRDPRYAPAAAAEAGRARRALAHRQVTAKRAAVAALRSHTAAQAWGRDAAQAALVARVQSVLKRWTLRVGVLRVRRQFAEIAHEHWRAGALSRVVFALKQNATRKVRARIRAGHTRSAALTARARPALATLRAYAKQRIVHRNISAAATAHAAGAPRRALRRAVHRLRAYAKERARSRGEVVFAIATRMRRAVRLWALELARRKRAREAARLAGFVLRALAISRGLDALKDAVKTTHGREHALMTAANAPKALVDARRRRLLTAWASVTRIIRARRVAAAKVILARAHRLRVATWHHWRTALSDRRRE